MKSSGLKVLVLMVLFVFKGVSAETIVNFMDMQFVKIPAGDFMMGLKNRELALLEIKKPEKDQLMDEMPAHRVVITKPFYMGKTEITQQQWYRVMENKPGEESLWLRKEWQKLPVSSVSWFMAARFVEELNKIDKSYKYRLPTEAEWEYVARSGSNDLRPVGNDELKGYAWYIESSNDRVQPVATRKANAYGVYDMLGSMWEWVGDWYDESIYSQLNRQDPQGPVEGRSKVRRGGSYHCPLYMVRPGYRSANTPQTSYAVTGFRVIAEYKK